MVQFRADLAPWPVKRPQSFHYGDPNIHWTPFGPVRVPFVGQGDEFMRTMMHSVRFRRAVDAVTDWAQVRYDRGDPLPFDLSSGDWTRMQRDAYANG